jgi:alpha-galactosidase
LRWHDPKTGLETRCVAVEYKDFPTVEWTLFFKNSSSADTPVLSDVQGLDTQWERSGAEEFVLHHHKGTFVRADDFEPLTTVLTSGAKQRFAPPGGRPLGWVLPYFNVDWSGQGVILAIGWPGQWAAAFQRDGGIGLRVLAGQESTNLRLHPGEEIRSPLIVLQFWSGDWIRAQNVWRRWMLAHTVPRREGKLPAPMMPAVGGNQFPGLLCNEADEIRYIDRYLEERIPITHWWMDAGWYEIRGDWTTTGTWEIDAKRFPRGLRSISDHAHANGLKLIVWFEPERVTAGSRLAEQHAEWVLGGKQGGLLDLGNPLAWQFNRPEVGSGIVQAFRRADSIYRSAQLQLRGLDPAATYEVTDLDAHRPARVPGHELPEPGLIVELPDRPAAALLTYRRVTP